ncbi:MAG: ribosomal protein S18-alanine N-acetyltransferase [Acidobacteriota bacterium]|nr:ribosomal protein S18-alanine N-acetyltransferase [Acidobacteriota bacterium]
MYRNSELDWGFDVRTARPEPPWDSLNYRCLAAVRGESTLAYLVWREVTPGEIEILDVKTRPEFRRRGIARALLQTLLREQAGAPFLTVFLEVRESNEAARNLYRAAGFREIGRRKEYYSDPVDHAIVMKFHS